MSIGPGTRAPHLGGPRTLKLLPRITKNETELRESKKGNKVEKKGKKGKRKQRKRERETVDK